ncbi:hypothetical protein Tsubulata_010741 [Turnera subulata]|uniref:H(+)-exporting diphosphatase n=1 Tax=Turnera subulata TaxID=218843 RepID=A0A9Q0FM55_9ROSI|nr:hypothetical protein Tsubulata_010741 [Turnera subulata]
MFCHNSSSGYHIWGVYTFSMVNFALCGLVGIITAYAFVWITKYYTDYKHEPVRTLALASSTGHGTNIIAGVSLGLESAALPVLVISISIISAFWLGHTSGLVIISGKNLAKKNLVTGLMNSWQSVHLENIDLKENSKHIHVQENPSSTHDHPLDLTPEDIGKLQAEVNRKQPLWSEQF